MPLTFILQQPSPCTLCGGNLAIRAITFNQGQPIARLQCERCGAIASTNAISTQSPQA